LADRPAHLLPPLLSTGGRRWQESNPPDGFARPTRFEDEGGHQTPFTSGAGLSASLPSEERPSTRRSAVKKLLVLLILVPIGMAGARRVREACPSAQRGLERRRRGPPSRARAPPGHVRAYRSANRSA